MRNKKLVFTLLIISITFCSAAGLYYLQRYQNVKHQSFNNTAKQALHQLVYTEREYSVWRDQLISVMELLSHSQRLIEFSTSPSIQNKKVLEEVWESVLSNQKWYTQIHLLDLNGIEQVRMNYSFSDGIVTVSERLQDKSQKSYFSYAKTLRDEEISAWGIELETDHGELVYPYKPVLRIITPVSAKGQVVGYLVINIDVWNLASRLNFSPDHDVRAEVVNESGYYIASHNSSKLFGDSIPERKAFNLKNIAPKLWEHISEEQTGYVFEDNNLFAFNKVSLAAKQKLFLVVQLNETQLLQKAERDLDDLAKEQVIVLFAMLIFAIPVAFLVVHYRRRNIESKLARAALNGMSAVMISDKSHRTLMVNNEFESMTGYGSASLEGKNALKILFENTDDIGAVKRIWTHLAEDDVWEGEVTCKTKLRFPFTAIMRVHVIKNASNKASYFITSLVDISDRKELEDRLRVLSERDSLSQLWNRRKFEEQLEYHARLCERYPNEATTCLALVDIDHFKRINDELGHDEGDRVIQAVAQLLVTSLRTTDFVARVGGEEFALLMPHTSLAEAQLVLNRLREQVEQTDGTKVTISIGFTDLTNNSTRSYKCADIALYESKSSGRNQVSLCGSQDDIA
ncbi:diguanylate cyclase [Vibrio sp. 99-70-13A1]|uniref:sensor domain-containing diguanylate cyclase n=1 Tax=Vibrio sp. 99-70-13A1 TaxID=2607601 RepID=UPI0014938033|nr:diguanylate cyclase [Vibrio sp. 99-70-13A1]NOH96393.1 diguanylate cyclase [Vibrio sp. 99-70-13A1]